MEEETLVILWKGLDVWEEVWKVYALLIMLFCAYYYYCKSQLLLLSHSHMKIKLKMGRHSF